MRIAPLCLLLLMCSGASIARAQFLPALRLQPITISDPAVYAPLIVRANTTMKARHDVPLFLRAYVAMDQPGTDPDAFALYPSGDRDGLAANQHAFATDPALATIRQDIDAVVTAGPATYVKAVRFDGTNAPGWLCNHLIQTNDEPKLLSRVTAMTDLFAGIDVPPPKINVFRVIDGESSWTHLVSINTSSPDHLAAVLKRLADAHFSLGILPHHVVRTTRYAELSP